MILLKNTGRVLVVYLLLPALFLMSCATYNQQALSYYSSLQGGDYEKASKALDHNRLLKKQRNRLLYLLEKGKVEHLLQRYDSSNRYFNEADLLMEDARTTAGDMIAGTLLNPMVQTYQGEPFEKYMVHYYKAINYLQLNQTEEALVEARRINLRTYMQESSTGSKQYSEDAFSHMLQGMIYEKSGDINNAFIAYRNAVNVYLEHGLAYYGTAMPGQLKKDLLRMAYLNGFTDELERYEGLLDLRFEHDWIKPGGELILFWENGLAPVKREQNLFFSLVKDNGGNLFFVDGGGSYSIPFDLGSGYNTGNISASDLRSFRVALPVYEEQPLRYSGVEISLNDSSYHAEPAQNINDLALATLRERRLKDLSKTLTRLAIKKIAEEAARPKEDEKDKKKKQNGEAIALGLQLFSLASEKADTRNWQSLPHTIYYTRVPLNKGLNTVSLDIQRPNGKSKNLRLDISNTGGLVFQNICTVR
ncbi:MAG TPA: hypothetical protein VFR58_00350 [Flavisolibacter sp.]|nr:hypothetical protein [Flavisolibacter sp.]